MKFRFYLSHFETAFCRRFFVVTSVVFFSVAVNAEMCRSYFPEASRVEVQASTKFVLDEARALLKSTQFGYFVEGGDTPRWNDYNKILGILEQAERSAKSFSSTERESIKNQLEPLLKPHRERLLQLKSEKDPIKLAEYKRFLDYHLAYFRLLEKVNVALKTEVFPLPDFSLIPHETTLVTDAKKTLKRLEDFFEEVFPTTGHANYEEFKKYVDNYSEFSKSRREFFENEAVIAVHRPESARFWIPISGFQNQRVTGTSNGAMFDDSTVGAVSARDKAEANFSRESIEDFVPRSARYKPTYGEARPPMTNQTIMPSDWANGYGKDLWIVKSSVVHERTTVTPKDSLYSARVSQNERLWNKAFIPWKYRALLTPFSNMKESFDPTTKRADFKLNEAGVNDGTMYFEAQIWGPLQLKDIQSFVFLETPPDKAFYELLVKNGIEVWDERTWPAKRYDGKESR